MIGGVAKVVYFFLRAAGESTVSLRGLHPLWSHMEFVYGLAPPQAIPLSADTVLASQLSRHGHFAERSAARNLARTVVRHGLAIRTTDHIANFLTTCSKDHLRGR